MDRKPLFELVRRLLRRPFLPSEVVQLDEALGVLLGAEPARHAAAITRIGAAGIALIKRFEQDSRMEPAEAYALCLIDGVADMPALQSRASATAELTNEGKDFRLAA